MKVILVLPSLAGGGAERVALTLGEEIAKEHKVTMVAFKDEGALRGYIPASVEYINLGKKRISGSVFALARVLRLKRPDVVISFMKEANVVSLLSKVICRGACFKHIVSEHNNLDANLVHLSVLRKFVTLMLMRFLYPMAESVISVSQGVQDGLIRNVGRLDGMKVVYNPIISDSFFHKLREGGAPDSFNCEEEYKIVSVGRLIKQKNQSLLIEALKEVNKVIDARLFLLGEGEQRNHLESYAKKLGVADKVTFLGFVENPYPYMKYADVFVLSSDWEGFGNVIVEALASGTRVISTDCPSGPREILENGRLGTLVPVGNMEYLSKSIIDELVNSRNKKEDQFSRLRKYHVKEAAQHYLSMHKDEKV